MDWLSFAGVAAVTYVVIKLSISIWTNLKTFVLARYGVVGVDLKSYGSWAAVTGATDGIGKGYAQELAKRGLNVFLISRSQAKLDAVAKEIEDEYKVQTRTLEIDFTHGLEIYPKIEAALAEVDLGVMVNNVGIAYPYPAYYCEVENYEKVFSDIIRVNCYAVTYITRIVLPRMVAKGKGVIVNVSSLGGIGPIPTFAVYGATKAYVNEFTETIAAEYKSKGIIVQLVLPGFLATPMSQLPPIPFVPEGPSYSKAAVATIGVQDSTAGYFSHNFVWLALKETPQFIRDPIWVYVLASMGRLLKRRIKKERKEKERVEKEAIDKAD